MLVAKTIEEAKKIIIAVLGMTLLILGLILLITPGPGILFIIIALVVLGTEFIWARKLLSELKKEGRKIKKIIRK